MRNDRQREAQRRLRTVLCGIFFIPFSAAIFLALGASLTTTVYYDPYQEADLPRFQSENLPVLLLLMAAAFLILRFMRSRMTVRGALLWAGTVSLYLILITRGLATNDALVLDGIVNDFMRGDFSAAKNGGYLVVYAFQIGYVAIGQLLYLLFGASNYLVYQLLNLAAILATIRLLYQITWELFERRELCRLAAGLSTGMLFLFVYATFVYGDIWSLAPEAAALLCHIRYLKRRKPSEEIKAAVYIGIAIVLKTNCYIALIAMEGMLLLDLLTGRGSDAAPADAPAQTPDADADRSALPKNGKAKRVGAGLLLMLLLFLVPQGMSGILRTSYARAAGMAHWPEGVPGITYFAMGMQETGGQGGWYNGYNIETYAENNYDRARTSEAAKERIRETLADFGARPLHACRFYVEKFLSQWADESCICMRELELTSRHVEGQPAILQTILYGRGRLLFRWVMNLYQAMVYLGAAVYCIAVYRSLRGRNGGGAGLYAPQALIVLYIFGGMLFHELWEGSSRYIIRYYIHLLPLAAYGIGRLLTLAENRLAAYGAKRRGTA